MNQQSKISEYVEDSNLSNNPHIQDILNARMSRRTILRGGVGMTAAMMLGSTGLVGCSDNDNDQSTTPDNKQPNLPTPKTLNFTPVAHSLADQVVVPEEYQVQAFLPVGLPLFSGLSDWSDTQARAGESFEHRMGDNHDGLWFYGMKDGKFDTTASERGLLAINHEYVEHDRLNPLGYYSITVQDKKGTIYAKKRLADDVRREVNAHGVAVVEVKRGANGQFELIKDSKFNRRITSATVTDISGPAAGSDLLKTKYDPTGLTTRGINNQCGSGTSPWGTYLTVEENFIQAFARSDDSGKVPANIEKGFSRYGLALKPILGEKLDDKGNPVLDDKGNTILEEIGKGANNNFLWHTPTEPEYITDEFIRWDVVTRANSAAEDYRNAYHTFGYIVEIDPFDPNSKPVKRTALGRFAHENCGFAPVKEGQPVVFYMGDDARGEYVYKFVSEAKWDAKDINGGIKAGQKYMDKGTLYVAKFEEGDAAAGKGTWIELTYGKNGLDVNNPIYPFSSQADVCIFTRLAADTVGATKMDRPEWVNTSPITGEVYLTLTNNNAALRSTVDAANPRNYDHYQGKEDGKSDGNPHGHVIRWGYENKDHTANTFKWDVFAFGAPHDLTAENLSGLNANNDFSSPDGLAFDSRGVLWIQTDDYAYLNRTNCMMLAALPGNVGDGQKKQSSKGQNTHVGATPNMARFLVGPKEAEITGVAYTPDMKTMFISIQHPGENGTRAGFISHWPDSQTNSNSMALPRSALAVITRKDGGVILG